MTKDEAHRQAEALAQAMDITVYVVRNADGEFLPVHVRRDDCEIIATVTHPAECSQKARTLVRAKDRAVVIAVRDEGRTNAGSVSFPALFAPGPPIRRPLRDHPR